MEPESGDQGNATEHPEGAPGVQGVAVHHELSGQSQNEYDEVAGKAHESEHYIHGDLRAIKPSDAPAGVLKEENEEKHAYEDGGRLVEVGEHAHGEMSETKEHVAPDEEESAGEMFGRPHGSRRGEKIDDSDQVGALSRRDECVPLLAHGVEHLI